MSHSEIMPGRPRGVVEGRNEVRLPHPGSSLSAAHPRPLATARPGSTALRPPAVASHRTRHITARRPRTRYPAGPPRAQGRVKTTDCPHHHSKSPDQKSGNRGRDPQQSLVSQLHSVVDHGLWAILTRPPARAREISTERPNHLAVSTHLCDNRTHVRR